MPGTSATGFYPKRAVPLPREQALAKPTAKPGKTAYIFPNSTSAYAGMARGIHESYPGVRNRFEAAERLLDFPLRQVLFDPAYQPNHRAWYSQAVVFLTSYCYYEILLRVCEFPVPDFVTGYSLGEITALTATQTLNWDEGLHLSATRGKLLGQTIPASFGGMAVIRNGDPHTIDESVRAYSLPNEFVSVAGWDSPKQSVISGHRRPVLSFCDQFTPSHVLPVDFPLHSLLMIAANEQFSQAVSDLSLGALRIPWMSNTHGEIHSLNSPAMRQAILDQLERPVQFAKGIRGLWQQGVRRFVEMGPGNKLSSLVREIVRPLNSAKEPWIVEWCDDGNGGFKEIHF